MKKYLLLIILGCCLMAKARAFGIKDVVKLSKSGVQDDVIIALIDNSVINADLTIEAIVGLHRQGVSEKVLVALIHKLARQNAEYQAQPQQRELSPFDRFFLSTYYSHQYGWPVPNYDSPKQMLEQGLYYRPPDRYPDASRVRIYGHYFSIDPRSPWKQGTWSPYSIIVPRAAAPSKKHRCYNPAKLRALLSALTRLQRDKAARQQRAVPAHETKPQLKAAPAAIETAFPLLGNWYQRLVKLLKKINQHKGLDIQKDYAKISQYQIWMLRLQHRICKQQRQGKNLAAWLRKCRQTARYHKQAIARLENLAVNQPLSLNISTAIASLQACYQECRANQRSGTLALQRQRIAENLQKIQQKFITVFRQLDILLFEFELE